MKINPFLLIVSIGISALLAFGLYTIHSGYYKELLAVVSFVLFSSTLGILFSFTSQAKGATANIKVLSITFFIIFLICNLLFSLVLFRYEFYIISNGILFLIFILIAYGISKSLKYFIQEE